ncbi:MAG: glycerophosphodiester phosphodiesterase [Planctomycetaceae bacterium]|nr:glycerophosphodiester phosphodiesterase [Planctomycetaceae bacterium]
MVNAMSLNENKWLLGFSERRVLRIAHRGARAFAPENTLPAIELAARLGADAVEIDVHQTKDEQVVVTRDDTLSRCRDIAERFAEANDLFVSSFTLDQLRTLNAGRWFADQFKLPVEEREQYLQLLTAAEIDEYLQPTTLKQFLQGVAIPTLEECLVLARDLGLLVNVEIKTLPRMYAGITEQVVDVINHVGAAELTLVSSFDHQQVLECRRRSEAIATAVVVCERLANVPEYLERLGANAYHPGCYGDFDSIGIGSLSGKLDTELFDQLRGCGFGSNAWTVNKPDHIDRLRNAGVTGLIGDFPNRLQP